jgi:hypothetical protein
MMKGTGSPGPHLALSARDEARTEVPPGSTNKERGLPVVVAVSPRFSLTRAYLEPVSKRKALSHDDVQAATPS